MKASVPQQNLPRSLQQSFQLSFRSRSTRTLLITAVIFILLGLGNVGFGRMKLNHYEPLLRIATAEVAVAELEASRKKESKLQLLPGINMGHQRAYINKLNWAMSFYSFVILGGRVFLAIAGVLLLAILATVRLNPPELPDDREGNLAASGDRNHESEHES